MRTRTTVLATGLSLLLLATAGAAHAYQPQYTDVTNQTISHASPKAAATVLRSVVETNTARIPTLAYAYRIDPAVPGRGACELFINDTLVESSNCAFMRGLFVDELRDAQSGQYVVKADGARFSSFTFTRPTAIPRKLQSAGCRLVGAKVAKKPTTVKRDPYLSSNWQYTYRLSGKIRGPRKVCSATTWTAGVSFTYGAGMGFSTATIRKTTKKLTSVTFSTSKSRNVTANATLHLSGSTPGWRANIQRQLKFRLR